MKAVEHTSLRGDDRPLVVVGAGGFAKEVLASYGDISAVVSSAPVFGLVDDDTSLHGSLVFGHPVLGDLQWLFEYGISRVRCTVAIGDPRSRARVVRRLDEVGAAYANVIHPTAVVWGRIEDDAGVVALPFGYVSAGAYVGRHTHLSVGALVGHDVRVEAYATVGPWADINGHCVVGEGAYLGAHAALRQGVTVGAWATVGMCACVLNDVPPGATVVGVPARPFGEPTTF
jgi:sugar O-acyltransferase (sialic acid O-acetyltransferase NeuD family)